MLHGLIKNLFILTSKSLHLPSTADKSGSSTY